MQPTAGDVVDVLRNKYAKKLKKQGVVRIQRSKFMKLAQRARLKGGFTSALWDAGFGQDPAKPLIIGIGGNFVVVARDYD